MAALKRFEIDVADDQLLCSSKETGSNKTSRRTQIEARFNVLVYVGDNLRDFDERFRHDDTKGIAGRFSVVDELESKFGIDWVILTNPMYGEWNKVFSNSEKDVDLLYE